MAAKYHLLFSKIVTAMHSCPPVTSVVQIEPVPYLSPVYRNWAPTLAAAYCSCSMQWPLINVCWRQGNIYIGEHPAHQTTLVCSQTVNPIAMQIESREIRINTDCVVGQAFLLSWMMERAVYAYFYQASYVSLCHSPL
jgi:hypothetical protein